MQFSKAMPLLLTNNNNNKTGELSPPSNDTNTSLEDELKKLRASGVSPKTIEFLRERLLKERSLRSNSPLPRNKTHFAAVYRKANTNNNSNNNNSNRNNNHRNNNNNSNNNINEAEKAFGNLGNLMNTYKLTGIMEDRNRRRTMKQRSKSRRNRRRYTRR